MSIWQHRLTAPSWKKGKNTSLRIWSFLRGGVPNSRTCSAKTWEQWNYKSSLFSYLPMFWQLAKERFYSNIVHWNTIGNFCGSFSGSVLYCHASGQNSRFLGLSITSCVIVVHCSTYDPQWIANSSISVLCISPLHVEFCFGQWNIGKCDSNRDLISNCTMGLNFL